MGALSLVIHAIADPRRRSAQQLRRGNGVCEWVPGSPRGKGDPREPGEQRRLAVRDPGDGPVHLRGRPGLQFAECEEHRSRRPEQRGTGAARGRDGPRPPELAVRHGSGHAQGPRRGRGRRRPELRVLRLPMAPGPAGQSHCRRPLSALTKTGPETPYTPPMNTSSGGPVGVEQGGSGGASPEPIAASYSRFTAGLSRVRGYCVTEEGDSLSLAVEPWFTESGSSYAVPCMRIMFRREGEQIILERFEIEDADHRRTVNIEPPHEPFKA